MKINTNKQNRDVHLTTADRLESSAFCVEDICRWFRVPAALVDRGESGLTIGGHEQEPVAGE